MFDRCVIIGSGASIRQSLWNIPIDKLSIWKAIKNEITFGLNWSDKWHIPTIQMFVDYQLYITRQKEYNKLPLVIGKDDPHIGLREYDLNKKCIPGNNLILLPSSSEFHGTDSWTKGFGKGQLVGLMALTLACILGFKNIYLIGFDACEIEGKTHFYQGDKENTGKYIWQRIEHNGMGKINDKKYRTSDYNKDVSTLYFDAYKEELKKRNIYNVSLQSQIKTFPKISYNDFYATLKTFPNKVNQNSIRNNIINLIKNKLNYNPIRRRKQIFI